MTAVLFLVSLSLAATLGWMLCALMTARRVAAADRHAHRCQARETRLLAECEASWRGYMVVVVAERDQALTVAREREVQLLEMAEFLAVVTP